MVDWLKGFPGGSDGKESAHSARDTGSVPGLGRSPGEGNATHSSTLAWRIPWTEEPGGLQIMGPKESDMTEWETHTHKNDWKQMALMFYSFSMFLYCDLVDSALKGVMSHLQLWIWVGFKMGFG